MAYSPGTRYTGSWFNRTQAARTSALQAPPDPEHLNPTANIEFPDGLRPLWASTAGAPWLPVEVQGDAPNAPVVGGGPVDQTPLDHAYGMGTGPGLTVLESQDKRGPWHQDDQGSVAAHAWNPMKNRDDLEGSPHADFIPHMAEGGDSFETLQLKRTGAGQPNDPEARPGRAFRRWRDRYIDMHRYDVAMRPLTPRYAKPNQIQPAVPDGTQLNSPFGTSVGTLLGPQDRFVGQLVRRAPGDWAEALSTDGTGGTIVGAVDNYGLTRYGL